MWIFLLSDTFIFSCFLLSYMTVRMSTTVPWPNPSEVFALTIGGKKIPLILIAIMTFVLISSSGTMAMAVNYGYRRDRVKTAVLMLLTAAFGATFVGMQAFEWTKLITEGVRPWGNPWGAAQFGSTFFMITGFHGTHVTIGVIFLIIMARKVLRGDFDSERRRLFHQQEGQLRDRRNHGSLLALRRSGVGLHLCVFLSLVRRKPWHRQSDSSIAATAARPEHARRTTASDRLYLMVWGLLFVLSTCSYLVDYFNLQGYLRWSLILAFMILKAGLIVAVFMHMAWERLALIYAILLPPVLVLLFVGIMVLEADYTFFTRELFFRAGP